MASTIDGTLCFMSLRNHDHAREFRQAGDVSSAFPACRLLRETAVCGSELRSSATWILASHTSLYDVGGIKPIFQIPVYIAAGL